MMLLEQFTESQKRMNYFHRFRTIFAVFESMAKTIFNMNEHIDYRNSNLKTIFIEEIKQSYSGKFFPRFQNGL